jgi:hypothetical protein
MDWKPKAQILADTPGSEPPKPSKPGFGGFDGATFAKSPEIEASPDPADLARASTVLNRTGVRIMALEDGAAIGVWADLDGPEIRAALSILELDRLPIRFLDGDGIPMRYRQRRVPGEPVPLDVLIEMERAAADPWVVRDRKLGEIGWRSHPILWTDPPAAASRSRRGDYRRRGGAL